MIKAIIFDLDGTLVQTEILKAHSYGKAVSIISGNSVTEEEVINGFRNYVGLSRENVVKNIIKDYSQRIGKSLIQINKSLEDLLLETRLEIYNTMLEDPVVVTKYSCEMTLRFLKTIEADNFKIGLATMSHCMQVEKVLGILGINKLFDNVITRDEILNGKPHPEIYLRMKNKFNMDADECLVIEDSAAGIKAAINAEMHVFAITNSITREAVHKSKLIEDKYIIDNPAELQKKVYNFITNSDK